MSIQNSEQGLKQWRDKFFYSYSNHVSNSQYNEDWLNDMCDELYVEIAKRDQLISLAERFVSYVNQMADQHKESSKEAAKDFNSTAEWLRKRQEPRADATAEHNIKD